MKSLPETPHLQNFQAEWQRDPGSCQAVIPFLKLNYKKYYQGIYIMRKPKFAIEATDDQRPILVVECPECGDKSRFLLDDVPTGTSVLCNCGAVMNITDNDLKAIREKID